MHTDDLGNDAVDVLDKYASQVERQIEYLRVNLGIINSQDSQNEMLFKMVEQIKHVNSRVTDFIKDEEYLEKIVRTHANKPEIFRHFLDIPGQQPFDVQIENVNEVDSQLQRMGTLLDSIFRKGSACLGLDEEDEDPYSADELQLVEEIKQMV